jgi:hypothetical protein
LPEINSFLEASKEAINSKGSYFPNPEAEILCITQDNQQFKWLGVRWYGPEDGALFVLDDKDKRIDILKLGAMWVDYLILSGTGHRLLYTALSTLSDEKINMLWSHVLSERNFMLPQEGGTETAYTVSNSKDGRTITVSGIIKKYSSSKIGMKEITPDIRQLEEERFCWGEVIGGYTLCK